MLQRLIISAMELTALARPKSPPILAVKAGEAVDMGDSKSRQRVAFISVLKGIRKSTSTDKTMAVMKRTDRHFTTILSWEMSPESLKPTPSMNMAIKAFALPIKEAVEITVRGSLR